MSSKIILNSNQLNILINRLVCQLIENHNDFTNTVLIGLQPRGVYFLNRIISLLKKKYKLWFVGHNFFQRRLQETQ